MYGRRWRSARGRRIWRPSSCASGIVSSRPVTSSTSGFSEESVLFPSFLRHAATGPALGSWLVPVAWDCCSCTPRACLSATGRSRALVAIRRRRRGSDRARAHCPSHALGAGSLRPRTGALDAAAAVGSIGAGFYALATGVIYGALHWTVPLILARLDRGIERRISRRAKKSPRSICAAGLHRLWRVPTRDQFRHLLPVAGRRHRDRRRGGTQLVYELGCGAPPRSVSLLPRIQVLSPSSGITCSTTVSRWRSSRMDAEPRSRRAAYATCVTTGWNRVASRCDARRPSARSDSPRSVGRHSAATSITFARGWSGRRRSATCPITDTTRRLSGRRSAVCIALRRPRLGSIDPAAHRARCRISCLLRAAHRLGVRARSGGARDARLGRRAGLVLRQRRWIRIILAIRLAVRGGRGRLLC